MKLRASSTSRLSVVWECGRNEVKGRYSIEVTSDRMHKCYKRFSSKYPILDKKWCKSIAMHPLVKSALYSGFDILMSATG